MHDIGDYFERLRGSKRYRLKNGEIRLTIGQQEWLVAKFDALREWIRAEGEMHNFCTRNILGEVCKDCNCGKREITC